MRINKEAHKKLKTEVRKEWEGLGISEQDYDDLLLHAKELTLAGYHCWVVSPPPRVFENEDGLYDVLRVWQPGNQMAPFVVGYRPKKASWHAWSVSRPSAPLAVLQSYKLLGEALECLTEILKGSDGD